MKRARSQRTWVAGLVIVGITLQIASGAAEPNGIFPNDPLFPRQWDLHDTGQSGAKPGVDINAAKAWEITTGDPNIIVAIMGEGLELDHPDLVNNLVPGYDFFDNDDRPEPSYGALYGAYDTLDAGAIAAEGNNGIGVAGVTWHCKIMPVRFLNRTPDGQVVMVPGSEAVKLANGAAAFRWAATHGADVVHYNHNSNEPAPPTVRSAYLDITKPGGIGRNGKGCVLVGRAFHSGVGLGWVYDAKLPEWISVHAVDPWDHLLVPHDPAARVDLVAPVGDEGPGPDEPGTVVSWVTDLTGPAGWSEGDHCAQWGQTAACALVSGVAALVLSVEPDLTNEEVRHYLCRSAHDLGAPGRDDEYGWGRVDARAALDMVLAKRADLNNDWVVDENDLAILTAARKTNDLRSDIAPVPKRDGLVDGQDEALLRQYLGTEIPEFGLLAHWTLDETEGPLAHGTLPASPGTGALGLLVGGPVWQPAGGRKDGALRFDGVDDYVKILSHLVDPAAGAFSVFAWVQGGGPGQAIVSQADGATWLGLGADGALRTTLQGTARSAGALVSSAVITDGLWHRVGLVWDGNLRTLYVDGIEAAHDAKSPGTPPASTGGLYFGAGDTLAAGTFWSGRLDDVRLYDRAVKP